MILPAKKNCEAVSGGREKIILHYKDNGITLLKEYIIGAAGWGTAREITQRDR